MNYRFLAPALLAIVATLVACQGAIGPEGPAGRVGPVGPEGPQGAIGPKGPTGDSGPVGPPGSVGPEGAAGDLGPSGPQGLRGQAGPQGPQGEDGIVSLQGKVCPGGSVIAGIGADGRLICVPIVIATPTPTSSSPTAAGGGAAGDTTAPQLNSLVIDPQVVFAGSAEQFVSVTLSLTDDLSGARTVAQIADVCILAAGQQQALCETVHTDDRISGDALDGLYRVERTIQENAPTGEWKVSQIAIWDNVDNLRIYNESDLLTLGFDITFTVA